MPRKAGPGRAGTLDTQDGFKDCFSFDRSNDKMIFQNRF